MSDKQRQRMAVEAARLVSKGRDMATARFRAARTVRREWVPENELPTEHEIRQALGTTASHTGDRFAVIAESARLLATLRYHPRMSADDGLEHALIVFATVYAECPYDEELLTAALLLHAGLVIDRAEPVAALQKTLAATITPRTGWLLEAASLAKAYAADTLGQRARHRLEAHPDFEQACLLADAERKAAAGGGEDPLTLDEAIAVLRNLEAEETDHGGVDENPTA